MPKTTGHRDREKYLVARLAKKIPSIGSFGRGAVRLGIGDDSAVLRPSGQSEFVVSCDFSLEGVHFRDAIHPATSIGYRCVARAASDIAAMGARPRYFLLALALPAEKASPVLKRSNWFDAFASGMGRAARELGLLLIGGDITVSPSVTICVTVIGELPAGRAISRSGARPGDLIYVTGTLGAAQLGLELLLEREHFVNAASQSAASSVPRATSSRRPSAHDARQSQNPTGQAPELQALLQPHLYPRIPVALAQDLARRRVPSAMMDISDGLSTDLARLCESSRAGARLLAAKLPLMDLPSTISNCYCHPERSEGSAFRVLDPVELALQGGEDYALLFTVPPNRAHLLRAIAAKAKTRITHIGEITRSRKILLIDSTGRASLLEPRGWNPFHE